MVKAESALCIHRGGEQVAPRKGMLQLAFVGTVSIREQKGRENYGQRAAHTQRTRGVGSLVHLYQWFQGATGGSSGGREEEEAGKVT